MKVTAVIFVVVLATVAAAKNESADKEKRGAVSYTTQKAYESATSSPDVAYATAKVSPQTFTSNKEEAYSQYQQPQYQQVKYVNQPAPVAYQHQYEYEQQAYAHPSVSAKLSSSSKSEYPSQAIQYSLASDVSSFSYNSPLVSYSNLGLLKQSLGKLSAAPQASVQTAYASQPAQYSGSKAYTSAAPQHVSYIPSQRVQYSHQPQKVAYAAQAYAAQAPQKVTYVAAPQKVAYAQQQQVEYAKAEPQVTYATQVHAQPQKYAYAAAPEAYEKVTYAQAPQQVAYAAAAPQHVAYASAPHHVQYVQAPQYEKVAYVPQHVAYQHQAQQQQQQQQQYTAAHSAPQPTYAAPQEHQYYQKYVTPGVTYA